MNTDTPASGEATVVPPNHAEAEPAPGCQLTDGQRVYAARFNKWMLSLTREDFTEACKVLNQLQRAYFKHCIQVHSPPPRVQQDVPSETSAGPHDPGVPDPSAAS